MSFSIQSVPQLRMERRMVRTSSADIQYRTRPPHIIIQWSTPPILPALEAFTRYWWPSYVFYTSGSKANAASLPEIFVVYFLQYTILQSLNQYILSSLWVQACTMADWWYASKKRPREIVVISSLFKDSILILAQNLVLTEDCPALWQLFSLQNPSRHWKP